MINQDNKLAILLANYRKYSERKKTKNIKIRYFFIMDKVKKGEVKLQHWPINETISDYFTKPLQ